MWPLIILAVLAARYAIVDRGAAGGPVFGSFARAPQAPRVDLADVLRKSPAYRAPKVAEPVLPAFLGPFLINSSPTEGIPPANAGGPFIITSSPTEGIPPSIAVIPNSPTQPPPSGGSGPGSLPAGPIGGLPNPSFPIEFPTITDPGTGITTPLITNPITPVDEPTTASTAPLVIDSGGIIDTGINTPVAV